MEAVKEGNSGAVKLLLAHGADVNARTDSFASAFQIAAQHGDVEIGKLLLAKGANPAVPLSGESPLHEAAIGGRGEFVKLLLDAGLKHDLYSAIASGEIELVRRGLVVDPSRALRPDGADRMPLDYAASNGQLEIAKLLLASGAPIVSAARVRKDPPLHRAIAREDIPMIELLLKAGSSPSTIVGWGEYASKTPALHLAIARKNLAIVKLLLAYKADLTARDNYSQTALHDVAASGQSEIVAALLEAGADVNVPQLSYELPCRSGDEEIPTNTTPLHFAAASGNPATIKVLLAAGAKVDVTTRQEETPLMFAVRNRRYEFEKNAVSNVQNVELLLSKGADINWRDREGHSVLDIAMNAHHSDDARSKQDHAEMLALLQKHGAKPGVSKIKQPNNVTPAPAFADDPFGGK